MSKKKTITQSYIFDKRIFKTNEQVEEYLQYKRTPIIIDFTKTKRVIRVNRNKFKNNSFRTKKIDTGIKIIKGVLK